MNNINYNILITGVSGTLGTELKLCCENYGYKVYGHSLNSKADIIADFNDLSHLPFFENFIEQNNITCIINNAGIYSDTNFVDLSNNEILKILNINLISPIIITKYFYNYITKYNKTGLIININSLAGKFSNYKEAIYCASKFGLNGFGSSLSMNQQKSRISVMDCYFGGIKTNMTLSRDNYNTLIEPTEAAAFIVKNIKNCETGIVSTFEYRKVYDN
jgi:short-subunit dehydrogenase